MSESPRPVRQRRSDATQIQVLDAAVRVLVNKGYAGASTLAIQAEAGVSRGRMLHHFPSRDELLLAAVKHLATSRSEALPSVLDWPAEPAKRIEPAIEIGWTTFHQPYFVASMELWVAARTKPALAGALLPSERQVASLVKTTLEELLGPELVSSPRYRELYPLLLSSMRGTAMTYMITRRDPASEPQLKTWSELTRTYLLDPADVPQSLPVPGSA